MKKRCCGFTSGCGRAIRRSWKRPRPCSTRSSTTPTATGWAAWAASASTASWVSTCRKTRWCCGRRTCSTRSNTSLNWSIGDSDAHVDDIDHLGNRRLRTIDELACDEMRKGFLKLRRTVQERMSLKDIEDMTPRSLINPKSISAAIEYFFGRGELSQVVDQTNPLSMLTHERRLSALGPGGLNRKRAGFEVRDVHISHYGRICPIETPEGTNIGLISSLAMYASVDEYGFLITPYRKISKGKLTDDVVWLRADEESEAFVASADVPIVDNKIQGETIVARHRADFELIPVDQIQYIDVTPSQMIGVSAGLIPFLEHDDANRALMGSNMQRQAVPLLITEPPIVGTGLERDVAVHSGHDLRAGHKGTVTYVDADRIEIGPEVHRLRKFVGLNERTCQNQKPIVKVGDKVEKGQVIADGAATYQGELALGRNVLVAFMSWEGFNFEDAIIISEELVKNDTYTSIHIEEFDVEIRETKLGREEFTRDIPNVSEKMLRNLDENGIVKIGTYVLPGDILVGKVSPKIEDRADAGRKAVARDLRPGRRGCQKRFAGGAVGRRRDRHRHAAVLPPDEPLRRSAEGI